MSEHPLSKHDGDLGRSDSWIFLSSDPASVQIPETTLEKKRPRRASGPAGVALAVAGVIALYIWDDLLLAAPIIAVAGWAGIWTSFFTFSAIYGLGSFMLAMIAVRSYEKISGDEKSSLARFIEAQTTGRRGKFAHRLIDGGKLIGFTISSIALGGIATTWLIRYAGRTEGLVRIAALSCAIFGIGFAATYTGVAAIVF